MQTATLTNPLDRDLPCRDCGYNLRGLSTDGRCPECSLSVAESNRGDAIEHANPAWLSVLYRGALWARIGWFASAVVVIPQGIALCAGWPPGRVFLMSPAVVCLFLAPAVLCLTTANPGELSESPSESARRVARAGFPFCVLNFYLTLVALRIGIAPGIVLAVNALTGPSGPAGIATMWALTRHLALLARRSRLPDQVKEMRFLWRSFLVAAVLTNVWLLLPWLIPAIPRPRWYQWAFLAPGLAPVIPLLLGHCIQALHRQWKKTLPPAVTVRHGGGRGGAEGTADAHR